jgi:hypothetical protein
VQIACVRMYHRRCMGLRLRRWRAFRESGRGIQWNREREREREILRESVRKR